MATFGGFGGGGGFGAAPATPSPFGAGAGAASGFGAPSTPAFGAGKPAFGAPATGFGGGFGAAAQPGATQPASGFGGFGAAATGAGAGGFGAAPAVSTGFGGFGAATSAAPVSTGFGGGFGAATTASSPFGAPKPAASSPFGSTSMFGGGNGATGATSGFGAPAATGGFGSPAPAFGAASTGFGAAPKTPFGAATTGAFGQPAATGATGFGGFGQPPAAAAAPAAMQVGTGQPPYQPTREVEPSGVGTANYVSISRMPAYAHKSAEELRYEDYLKRTNPAAAQAVAMQNAPPAATAGAATGAGAFGATTSAFGAQPATSGAFGATTGAFGATTGGFGSAAAPSTGFGATSTFGSATSSGFGTSSSGFGSTGGSLFGKPAATAGAFGTAAPATGAFGAPAATSAFGAPAATGAFGAPAAATTGFGAGGFGTTTATNPGFGGFGAPAAAAPTSGFGASSFGKPAGTTGFGFGTTPAAAPSAGGFNFGGAAAVQPAASTSLFGGTAATSTAQNSFGFGSSPKPAGTTGFNFGGTSGGGFGATTAGSGFGATAGTSSFGAPAAQPASTSLFGATTTGATGSGGFSFGGTSATPAASTGFFGSAPKPATGGLFGATTSTTPSTGSLFGGTTGGSSLFGGASTTPAAGTSSFGTGSFGTGTTNSFGGFGSATGGTSPTTSSFGGFGTSFSSGGLFGQSAQQQQQPQAAASQPAANLVAAPDVNPYGAGTFGAGLVEQSVKAALDSQSIKTPGSGVSSSRLNFDVGLPRGPMEAPLVTRRQSVTSRHTIPVSFVRGSFKGTKGRFASFASSAITGAARSGDIEAASKEDEFKFSSSLFRKSGAKQLVIDKGDQPKSSNGSTRASVIPFTDDDRLEAHEIGSSRSRQLKMDEDGKYSVAFRNLTNRKSFTLRLNPNQTIKQARTEVKQLLRASASGAAKTSIKDIELVWKGRIVEDSVILQDLRIKEGETVDIVVIEDNGPAEETKKTEVKKKSGATSSAPLSNLDSAPPKRYMTYDEFLANAIRDSADVDPTDVPSNSSPASPSCPVLNNAAYYTEPPYERLQKMSDSELSQVENFKVGCHGLGSVTWYGKTDVRYLNLDELIFFERKEVIVYKEDDHNKHPQGTGLNRPALVELLGIFPPRKSPSPEKYRERVKQRTEDIGAKFIEYSADKGIWQFRVEHFSRYGFDDDDDDEDVNMDGSAVQHVEVKNKMADAGRELQANRPSSATVSANRSALFRNSSMFTPASTAAVASFGEGTFTQSNIWVTGNSSMNHVEETAAIETPESPRAEKMVMPVSRCFPMPPISLKPLGLEANGQPASLNKSPTYQLMLQASSHNTGAARNHADARMFMARSFRCSWGPNGELVNLGRLVTKPQSSDRFDERVKHRVCIEFPLRSAATLERKASIREGIKLHYECASQRERSLSEEEEFENEKRSVPNVPHAFALPTDSLLVRCLHRYVSYAESLAGKSNLSSFAHKKLQLWKLVRALWGQEHSVKKMENNSLLPLAARDDPTALENLDTFQWLDLRRQFTSQWLEGAVQAELDSGYLPPSPETVLFLLLQHRVAEAAEAAMGCGDFRLATLVAQADSMESADFRALLESQMAQWSDNGTLEFMDETVILIYSLLAGSVEVVTSSLFQQGKLNSWLVGLALFYWYKQGPATSLETALKWLQDAITKQQTPEPRSQYLGSSGKEDVLMEIMKLYVDSAGSLCGVLSPSGWGSSRSTTLSGHHLDYELSWHLHSVLRAIGYRLDRQWESHIEQSFICQLEGAGLWEDALYVALTISDAVERASTCRALLMRNADMLHKLTAVEREELAVRLGISMEWVSESLAVLAVSKRARHEEIAQWMAAQKFEAAHACLMEHVAFKCLFAGEKEALYQLLADLEPHRSAIPQWSSCSHVDALGGGLVLEYLRLEQQKGLEAGREREYLERVQTLSQQLASAKLALGKSAEARVAHTCVASMVVALSTQAVQLQSLLSFTHERELEREMTASEFEAQQEISVPPLELQPEFLRGLARLSAGRDSSFVESFRSSQLLHVCSAFLEWRA